jgi:hypothetical protein
MEQSSECFYKAECNNMSDVEVQIRAVAPTPAKSLKITLN